MTIVEAHAPGKPAWFDLMTSDAESARRFYGELFGWTFDVGGPESGFYAMCILNGRGAAGLGQMEEGAGYPPSWTVYFNVENIEETLGKIGSAGGSTYVEPMDILEAGRMAVCADNEGAVFGLWQPNQHNGAGVIEEHGAMAWCEVNSRDAVRAAEFYAGVFGLRTQKMEGVPFVYVTLHQGEPAVCGAMQMTAEWGDMPSHWMAYFAVDNVDESVKIVENNGGKVAHGPFDSSYGRIAVIIDPQGAAFSIIQASAAVAPE